MGSRKGMAHAAARWTAPVGAPQLGGFFPLAVERTVSSPHRFSEALEAAAPIHSRFREGFRGFDRAAC